MILLKRLITLSGLVFGATFVHADMVSSPIDLAVPLIALVIIGIVLISIPIIALYVIYYLYKKFVKKQGPVKNKKSKK